mmetsp:Transcript_73776/g.130303  ORF Transcript_73776/g.130303 Transcript_73776/m.130303 type:complete len:522 (+) Transcript_73776:60-1625(+)
MQHFLIALLVLVAAASKTKDDPAVLESAADLVGSFIENEESAKEKVKAPLQNVKSEAEDKKSEERLQEAKQIVERVEKERAADAAEEAKELEALKKANADKAPKEQEAAEKKDDIKKEKLEEATKIVEAVEKQREADAVEEVKELADLKKVNADKDVALAKLVPQTEKAAEVTEVAVTRVEDSKVEEKAARRARLEKAVHEEKMRTPVVVHEELKVYAKPDFGNAACPCIGFDNVQGETLIFMGGKFVNYPGDLGSRCEAWDDGWEPDSCMAGQLPGKGNGWCAQKWCYVDPRNCQLDTFPSMSHYVPTARYKNMPLFWSYDTCGSKFLSETTQVATLGQSTCRCMGFDNMPGTMNFKVGIHTVAYPGETGGTCGAWDLENNPECAVKGEKPEYCSKKWCFVDPCSCKEYHDAPKISGYLIDSEINKRSIYFSYETCGEDVRAAEWNTDVCSIEQTQEGCTKKSKCAWSGKACLGKELVDLELCKASPTSAEKDSKSLDRSGAHRMGGATFALGALLVFFS